MIVIKNSYLVELAYPSAAAAGSQITFKDAQFLEKVLIVGIEIITADQMSTAPSGNAMASKANAIKGALTIVEGNKDKLFQLPNGQLITQDNAGIVKEFSPIKLNLSKCSVVMFAAGIAANESLCFNFYYIYPEDLANYLKNKK